MNPTSRRLPRAIATAAAILVLAACSAPTTTTGTGAAQPAKGADTPAAKSYKPTKLDFVLKVKITEKKCFGSAGCNVTYHIDMTYTGDTLDPSETWLITYQVAGVEDGPAINTLELTGDEYSYDEEEFGQTSSSSKKLTAKVTDIEKQ